MPGRFSFVKKLEGMPPVVREALVELAEEVERLKEGVLSRELEEVKTALKELAEAQRKSGERLSKLEEAQVRAEERLSKLEEAQIRTEERLLRLEEAVERLAEAQRRTEEELHLLAKEHRKTREQLGGLSQTVGYRLEDEAMKALPRLLERDYGVLIEGRLRRRFLRDNRGEQVEVNIVGEGRRDGRRVTIIGEGKSQLSKRDVDRFIRRKLRRFEGLFEEVLPVLVTYMISEPDVEDYVRQRGIALYYSYDL